MAALGGLASLVPTIGLAWRSESVQSFVILCRSSLFYLKAAVGAGAGAGEETPESLVAVAPPLRPAISTALLLLMEPDGAEPDEAEPGGAEPGGAVLRAQEPGAMTGSTDSTICFLQTG